ncbi:unnamed protein product [Adineta ricciae]|uniref:Cystatin domain-containing protein n=1 Tax=Adineta ricciae TaxID=249248 RepID=A0A814BW86_ADIRI|nr:unnamed protein product [Adineta ricciae]
MQTKTIFLLITTIVMVLIETSQSAPAAPKDKVAIVPEQGAAKKPVKVGGGRTEWKTKIDGKSKKLFDKHEKIVSKKIHDVHKIQLKTKLKPAKVASQIVSGVLYHYLVELPTKQYAYVTIHSQPWKKSKVLNEQHVTVRPKLYDLNDKNI